MQFTYKTTEEEFKEGKQMVQNKGGSFYTDGTFEIKGVEGELTYGNGTLTINITDKPWLASWDMIEDKLNDFFQ